MAERKRIGICYSYNENWIGGTYYIENLVKAINLCDDAVKPHIVVIAHQKKDYLTFIKNTGYPYLSFQLGSGEHNKLFQFSNKVTNKLIKHTFFNQKIRNLDAVFPYYISKQQSLATKKIFWIPDFQHHFNSNLFSRQELQARAIAEEEVANSRLDLILSSQDALKHFNELFPRHRTTTHVLPFAVSLPEIEDLKFEDVRLKYNIPHQYYISPNQFWQHKNHMAVLKAIRILKEKGREDIFVLFTGKPNDYRNPAYYEDLLAYIKLHHLEDQVFLLGFIDRKDQLKLMQEAIAVIQPSFFEGWSTVIEDAKSLNKAVIAANIDVNIEQLTNSTARFFDPNDAAALAEILSSKKAQEPLFDHNDYVQNIRNFGNRFLDIVHR